MEKSANHIFNKNAVASVFSLALVLALFVFLSFMATIYASEINMLAERGGAFGMAAYVFITILAVVVAPISTIPLIPVAAGLWGWVAAAILSIIGWSIGAQIALHIARYFGKPLVEKLVSIDKLNRFEERFSTQNMFWTIVFLRMLIPVDILSYAIGLFSNIGSRSYFFATVIGVTPFAFVFAYAGTLPVWLQPLVFLAAAVIFISWYVSTRIASR
ncbi:TVP38/TMEM64 family protein [Patescibacteria group bacterium]|nr:TVP38/TMEM64 family protein [Patescibacteria group bacterium]